MNETNARQQAILNFSQARRRANWERWRGRDERLLPFEVIRAALKQQNPMYRGIQQIPLEQIVGSVGRYNEFNRHFLPLNDSLQERWIRVETLAASGQGWPPIETYQVGNAYFVRDGNHRTAVARQMGNKTIEAHVWAFPLAIEIGPADSLDAVLIRFGERYFLDKTALDGLRPDHTIHLTTPGRYTELLAQIEHLHHLLCAIDERPIPHEEAVMVWYDIIYLPTVQIISESGLLEAFPGRSESDLFVWLSIHRDQLGQDYDNLEDLARFLAEQHKASNLDKLTRQVKKLFGRPEPSPLLIPETTTTL